MKHETRVGGYTGNDNNNVVHRGEAANIDTDSMKGLGLMVRKGEINDAEYNQRMTALMPADAPQTNQNALPHGVSRITRVGSSKDAYEAGRDNEFNSQHAAIETSIQNMVDSMDMGRVLTGASISRLGKMFVDLQIMGESRGASANNDAFLELQQRVRQTVAYGHEYRKSGGGKRR